MKAGNSVQNQRKAELSVCFREERFLVGGAAVELQLACRNSFYLQEVTALWLKCTETRTLSV